MPRLRFREKKPPSRLERRFLLYWQSLGFTLTGQLGDVMKESVRARRNQDRADPEAERERHPDLHDEVKQRLRIILVETVDEVLKLAIEEGEAAPGTPGAG